jgi:hypothetical protein
MEALVLQAICFIVAAGFGVNLGTIQIPSIKK